MLTCTFIKIDDTIYNANLIELISLVDLPDHLPFIQNDIYIKILIIFIPEADLKPKSGYTYFHEIGQIFYDWKNKKNNFFEITILNEDEIKDK